MRLRPLLIMILALTLLGSAAAEEGSATESVAPEFGVPFLANTTLTCSARLPSAVVGCFYERPITTLGPVELAVGVDAQAALRGALDAHVAAYIVAAVYLEGWSAWVEVFTPELVPPIGTPDWFRAGFTVRF